MWKIILMQVLLLSFLIKINEHLKLNSLETFKNTILILNSNLHTTILLKWLHMDLKKNSNPLECLIKKKNWVILISDQILSGRRPKTIHSRAHKKNLSPDCAPHWRSTLNYSSRHNPERSHRKIKKSLRYQLAGYRREGVLFVRRQ